jgi:hypothetical protein
VHVRRWAAALTVAAVIGAGAVAAPLAPAAPAQAVWTANVDTWAKAMNTTLSAAGKVFGFERMAGFFYGTGALAVAAPLLTLLFQPDPGPSLGDVMDKLGDIENQLSSIQQSVDAVDAEVRQTNVNVLMGTCSVETSALTSLLTDVETAQNEYSQMLVQMKNIDDIGDVQQLQLQTNGFIQTVFGAGNTGQTFVDGTNLGREILAAHNRLISTGGSHGVIETCGKAFLADWQNRTTSPGVVQSQPVGTPGAWLGDDQYYQPLQNLVVFWQTVEAQALYLLQQATYLQAVQGYATQVGPLSTEDASQACASVQKGSNAYALCSSGLQYSKSFRDNVVAEWRQTGVPYSDNSVVLSLGTDVTGLTASGGASIPSTVWARVPDLVNGTMDLGTPQTTSFPAGVTYDDLTGWAPAGSAQWNGMTAGLVASHSSLAGTPAPVVQPWSMSSVGDQYAASNVAPFTPVNVLDAMGHSLQSNGTIQFGGTQYLYWIPGETATKNLVYYANTSGLTFPQGYFLPDAPSVYGKKFLPYYSGAGLSIACMVAPVDGVLCDSATVGSWWVARQKSVYSIESSNWFTDNYTADAIWSVTPQSPSVPGFLASGRDAGCHGGNYCPVAVNVVVSSMPPWLVGFTDANGLPHDPAVEARATYTQRVWPTMTLPTDPSCTTVWNVPTRCGDALTTWLTANVADPAVAGPQATSAPTVTQGATADAAACTAPGWSSTTGPNGGALQYGDVTWTAVDPAGHSVTLTKPWGAQLSLTSDVLPAVNWLPRPGSFSIACNVTASFAGAANSTDVPSAALPAASVDGAWVVGAEPPAAVTDQPDSATADDGGSATLSATVAVAPVGAPSASAGAPSATDPTDAPSAPAPTPEPTGTPAALGHGGAPGRPAAALVPTVAADAVDGVTVQWQKRESGSDEWVDVDLSPTLSGTRSAGPRALHHENLTSQVTLSSLGAPDHGDAYRAVFTAPDGTRITTAGATISLTSVTTTIWAGVLAGVFVLLLIGVALMLWVARRRRSV